MSTQKTVILLYFIGVILLLCGVTLLVLGKFLFDITNISLLAAAAICGVVGFFMSKKFRIAFWAGLIFMSLSIPYFGWLTIVNTNVLVDMLLNGKLQLEPYHSLHLQADLALFSFLALVVTTMGAMLQFVRANSNGRELSA